MADLKMEAAIIFEPFLPNALFTSNISTREASNVLNGKLPDGPEDDATLGGMARYVAVAPRDVSTSLRDLVFEL